jgi:heme exporter protein C
MFVASPILIAEVRYESTMGLVQKIFYYHMPSAVMFLLAAVICGVASARYLFGGAPHQDRVAWAAAELTVLFGIITLVTGPLWARKAWGQWWVWDVRLTASLMGWLVSVAYLWSGGTAVRDRQACRGSRALRRGERAVRLHFGELLAHDPSATSVVPTLPVDMGTALWFCFAAFLLLFVLLLKMRIYLEEERARVDSLYLSLEG